MQSEFYAKLTFNGGHAPNYWSVDLRRTGQRGAIATIGHYPQPHMAVDAASTIWQEPVHMRPHEYEACCMGWQIEGMKMYANEAPVEACANEAIEHGWRWAFGRDVQYVGMAQ